MVRPHPPLHRGAQVGVFILPAVICREELVTFSQAGGTSPVPREACGPFPPDPPRTKTAPSPVAGRSLLWKEKSLRKQRDGFVNIRKRRAGWAPDVTGHQPELTDTATCPEGTIIIALILCPCQSPPSETLCIRKEHLFCIWPAGACVPPPGKENIAHWRRRLLEFTSSPSSLQEKASVSVTPPSYAVWSC